MGFFNWVARLFGLGPVNKELAPKLQVQASKPTIVLESIDVSDKRLKDFEGKLAILLAKNKEFLVQVTKDNLMIARPMQDQLRRLYLNTYAAFKRANWKIAQASVDKRGLKLNIRKQVEKKLELIKHSTKIDLSG